MRIKRVEVIGFKSFCDRAVLNIEQPITAVVGPNGCGKSNIIDAIRWCMGEQSAKHLRGKTMEDVIFAGSETRGPAPMAEVSLTFDDVGFSHETLAASMQSDEAQAEAVLAQVDAVPDVDAAALEGAPPPAELVEAAPALGRPRLRRPRRWSRRRCSTPTVSRCRRRPPRWPRCWPTSRRRSTSPSTPR
jgi:hypothetical protein